MGIYPKLRIAGFTDAWEQRKLGDLVSLRGRIGFRGYKETDLVAKGNGAITFSPADIDECGAKSQFLTDKSESLMVLYKH